MGRRGLSVDTLRTLALLADKAGEFEGGLIPGALIANAIGATDVYVYGTMFNMRRYGLVTARRNGRGGPWRYKITDKGLERLGRTTAPKKSAKKEEVSG